MGMVAKGPATRLTGGKKQAERRRVLYVYGSSVGVLNEPRTYKSPARSQSEAPGRAGPRYLA
jgi:hypothetical protein